MGLVKRSRVSKTVTIPTAVIDFLDSLVHDGLAKDFSQSIEICANTMMMNPHLLGRKLSDTQRLEIERMKADFIESFQEHIVPILMGRDVENGGDEEASLVPAVREAIAQANDTTTVGAQFTIETLLSKCPSNLEDPVRDWAAGWEREILTTGHSLEEFVKMKLRPVQATLLSSAPAAPPPVQSATLVSSRPDIAKTVGRRMVEMWLRRADAKKRGTIFTDTSLKFYVAFEADKLKKLRATMDNGSGDKLWGDVQTSLRYEAKTRNIDEDEFLNEWESIYYNSEQILQEQKSVLQTGE